MIREIYAGIYCADDMDDVTSLDILFNTLDNVFVTDASGRIVIMSGKASASFGAPIEQLIGSKVSDLVDRGIYDRSSVMECLRTKKTAVGAGQPQLKKDFFSATEPRFDKNGTLLYTITNTYDYGLLQTFTNALEETQQGGQRFVKPAKHPQDNDKNEDVIIAASSVMQQICAVCARLSNSDSTVLLTGETGTGKEVLARYIYQKSKRKAKPFVSVNCGSIPIELIESELFGYERGAFTGASPKGHVGLIESANHGTLFLDEIGEMPKSIQSKLLRFLEDGEIRHVGGNRSIQVDVRVICATNRNLHQMVKEGKFREDLYYRINVIPIELPPLRHRSADILPLAEHFLHSYNRKYEKSVDLDEGTAEQFMQYVWPGNIRELRNVIERMVVTENSMNSQSLLELPEPQQPPPEEPAVQPVDTKFPVTADEIRPFREMRSIFETEYIVRAIELCGGSIAQAARQLQIDRSLIYKRLSDTGYVWHSEK